MGKIHKKIIKFFAILPIAILTFLCYNNNVLKERTEREENIMIITANEARAKVEEYNEHKNNENRESALYFVERVCNNIAKIAERGETSIYCEINPPRIREIFFDLMTELGYAVDFDSKIPYKMLIRW